MALTQSAAIEVRKVRGKGRGIFARRPIEEGETIERVPVTVLPAEQVGQDPGLNPLVGYIVAWGRGTVALALGYDSLYDHSFESGNERVSEDHLGAK